MNKPISLSLVDESHKILAASLSCSFESHLVEDPLICNNPLCQALMCRSCLNSKIEKKCPKCQTFNYYFNSDLPLILKNQLNQIYLKCENHLQGCKVEVDYPSYRIHTNNCRFKDNINIIKNVSPINNYNYYAPPIQTQNYLVQPIPTQNYPNFDEMQQIFFKKEEKDFKREEKELFDIRNFIQKEKNKYLANEEISDTDSDSDSDSYSSANNFFGFKMGNSDNDLIQYTKKDFYKLTIEELKSILEKRNIARTGNKDELVKKIRTYLKGTAVARTIKKIPKMKKSLFEKRVKLEAYTNDQLKEMLSRKGLVMGGNKTERIERLLGYKKPKHNIKPKKNENFFFSRNKLEILTNDELKNICSCTGLTVGGNKTELIEKIMSLKNNFRF